MQLTQQVREYLAKTDSDFRRLYEKHQEFEQELDAAGVPYTPGRYQ